MLVGLTRSSEMPASFAYSSFRSLTQASEMVWHKQTRTFPQTLATDDCEYLLFLSQLLGSTISLLPGRHVQVGVHQRTTTGLGEMR
jgi:hypothetical protein